MAEVQGSRGLDPIGNGRRKRKADNQDNERLSKRLSLLNLERNGQRLYVPVEQPASSSSTASPLRPKSPTQSAQPPPADDIMQLDDTKHKVYIYDLDAELSDSESSDDGRLVFLPDIRKHLRDTRIPATILANSDGEIAGMNNQMVLYNVPSSLTVPEEQDSVRKAIIETRARARARQKEKRYTEGQSAQAIAGLSNGVDARDWYHRMTESHAASVAASVQEVANDPDAMDLG